MADAARIVAACLLLSAAGLSPAAAAPAPAASAGTLQCWTDDLGHRACGDSLPPAEARRQRETLNKRGLVKKVLPAEKTPEQVAEEARAAEEKKRQDAHDRYLMQSFADVGELEKARDDRLSALDGRLTFAQKALADNTAALENLRQREEAGPPEGETLDPTLKRRIREFAQAKDENETAITRIGRERADLGEQFERDIQRYRFLREASKPPAKP